MELDPIALGLPHRDPFLFVQAITEHTAGKSAAGWKTFSADDLMFRGHFPGEPIVPGVILTEALAQLAGIAGGHAGQALRLAAIRGMKFPAAARPGERLELKANLMGGTGSMMQFSVEARVGERVVAEGVLVLAEVG